MIRHLGEFDADGLLHGVRFIQSPNCDDRPSGCDISLAIIHAISLPPDNFGGSGVEQLFTNCLNPSEHPYYATLTGLRVSAHLFVRRDGSITQFVPCGRRAWHAGASSWQGRERCNDFSVGIELEGSDDFPFEDVQYDALAELIGKLAARYGIRAIAGHSDIAPQRKTDPGPHFEWRRLRNMLDRIGLQHVVTAQR